VRARPWIRLLVPLALSLGGCSRPALDTQTYSYGVDPCDGSLGNFDVYLLANAGQGTYDLVIVPIALAQASTEITVTLSTPSSSNYLTLIAGIDPIPDQQITAGPLTPAELQAYSVLAITPIGMGVPFPNQAPSSSTICYVPQLGDGIYSPGVQPIQ
jgi:hypothetical protein